MSGSDEVSAKRLWGMAAAAALIVVAGWWVLHFVCDDAYITFRYALMRRLGFGWTWNPPPFRPVEGYSSFLWLVLVDAVWTVFGVEPPTSAPVLGLLCGLGTLAVTTWGAGRVRPIAGSGGWWSVAVGVALLGLVTNKTFLVWTSSGLEAPMMVMLQVSWVVWATLGDRQGRWALVGSTLATLLALLRPDGLLYLAATPAVILSRGAWPWRPERMVQPGELTAFLPPLAVVAHVLWRRWTYGWWLPNTYYAKVVETWLEGGLNHVSYYIVENGWFFWAPLFGLALWRSRASLGASAAAHLPGLLALGTVAAHAVYYIWRVGGDHFAFRIYAHIPALMMLGGLVAVRAAKLSPRAAVGTLGVLVALTWPLPWWDLVQMWDVTGREEIKRLRVTLADKVPPVLQPWAALHDYLEDVTVAHSNGVPYQTHKAFKEVLRKRLPPPEDTSEVFTAASWAPDAEGRYAFPVVDLPSVGVPAWQMPYVAIIDRFGLNDLVIARTTPRPTRHRFMAHDRFPPGGYIPCLAPNVQVLDRFFVKERAAPMTPDTLRACEDHYLELAVAGELRSGVNPDED